MGFSPMLETQSCSSCFVEKGFPLNKMPYIIVRETETGTLVEGLNYSEYLGLVRCHAFETEVRDEASSRFVFDTDVNNIINILETLGISQENENSL